jgi:membrane protein DedA with SNARE-associated domain
VEVAPNTPPQVRLDLPADARPLTARKQRTVRFCLSTLAVLSSGSMIGVASSLYLATEYPLLLIALSPLGRHLVLVAPVVDPVAFVAVAVGRRMLFYRACFHLGDALGPSGITWIETRAARFARFVRWLERLFARASHAVVLTMAGPTVSALAGISGMRAGVFTLLATLGLIARMLALLVLAEWLRGPIESFRALIDEYWVPGTVVIVSIIAVHHWRRRKTASRGMLDPDPARDRSHEH